MKPRDDRDEFLLSTYWLSSWNASVQHAGVYVKSIAGTSDANLKKQKSEFRKRVIEWIDANLISQYRFSVSAKTHEKNLQALADFGTEIGKPILRNGRYRIGVAQKLLNLQLKYLWCMNRISMPPHCPIDSIIQKCLEKDDRCPWTRMSNIGQYNKVIRKLSDVAKQANISLAEWELAKYLSLIS